MSKVTSGSYSELVAFASELGCALNSSLATGGGSDDTAFLNLFLAQATALNPVRLVMDGVALVSGLTISATGHTTIEGLGPDTGFYLANGANTNIISAGKNPDGAVPAGRVASNLVLANFALNGNGGNQSASTSFGVVVNSYSRVTLDRLTFTGTQQYCSYMTNVNDVVVRRCSFTSSSNLQDGVHINGPAERILIAESVFATGDDGIALNCPEGYGGDITDVKITNCVSNDAYRLLRCYTSIGSVGNTYHMRRLLIEGCSGTTQRESLLLGFEQSTTNTPGQIVDAVVANCTFASPISFVAVQNPLNFLSLRGCIFIPLAAVPAVYLANAVGTVELRGFTILRNSDGSAAAYPVQHIVSVDRLVFAGVRITDELGSSYGNAPYMLNSGGSLTTFWVESVDPTHFAGISSNLGNITNVGGPGISSTGGAFPDAQVLDNCVYQSSTSGQISFKVSGTVHTLG